MSRRVLATCASFFSLGLGSLLLLSSSAALAAEPLVVGSLGDSISVGFNAQNFGNNPELSWSTGSEVVESYAQRLGAATQAPVRAVNEAVPGSVVTDLEPQVTRMLHHAPDYVTITIGSNDICRWDGVSDESEGLASFDYEMRTQIARLVAIKPKVHIFISPVVNLLNLREIMKGDSTCQALWDLTGVCGALLPSYASDETRQAVARRLAETNALIYRIAGDFAGNVFSSQEMAKTKFAPEHVSRWDCFHPSIAGQKLIAAKAWQSLLSDLASSGELLGGR